MHYGYCIHCERYTGCFYSNAHLGGNGYFDCGCKDAKNETSNGDAGRPANVTRKTRRTDRARKLKRL